VRSIKIISTNTATTFKFVIVRNQVIALVLVLVLVLLQFEIGRVIQFVSSWVGFGFQVRHSFEKRFIYCCNEISWMVWTFQCDLNKAMFEKARKFQARGAGRGIE